MNTYNLDELEAQIIETEIDAEQLRVQVGEQNVSPATEVLNTSLHPAVFQAFAAINIAILGVFWFAFRGDVAALFAVGVSAVYLAAFLGTPIAMSRIQNFDAPQDKPYERFLDEGFVTWTGIITGRQAVIQILTIPIALLLTVVGICIAIGIAR